MFYRLRFLIFVMIVAAPFIFKSLVEHRLQRHVTKNTILQTSDMIREFMERQQRPPKCWQDLGIVFADINQGYGVDSIESLQERVSADFCLLDRAFQGEPQAGQVLFLRPKPGTTDVLFQVEIEANASVGSSVARISRSVKSGQKPPPLFDE